MINEGTSFIPKKSVSYSNASTTSKSVDLIFLISMVIFLLSVFSAAGVFFYRSYLNSSIEQSSIMLEKEKDNFDTASVDQLSRLDKRINVATALLDKHIDLTGLFDMLETNTLKNIQFVSFDYSVGTDGVEINLKGVARDYSTVALQSDVFGSHPYIKNPIFSNLDVNNEGNVVFDFSAMVDPNLISYKKGLEQ